MCIKKQKQKKPQQLGDQPTEEDTKLADSPECSCRKADCKKVSKVVSKSLHITFPLTDFYLMFWEKSLCSIEIGLNDKEKFKFPRTMRKIKRGGKWNL